MSESIDIPLAMPTVVVQTRVVDVICGETVLTLEGLGTRDKLKWQVKYYGSLFIGNRVPEGSYADVLDWARGAAFNLERARLARETLDKALAGLL